MHKEVLDQLVSVVNLCLQRQGGEGSNAQLSAKACHGAMS